MTPEQIEWQSAASAREASALRDVTAMLKIHLNELGIATTACGGEGDAEVEINTFERMNLLRREIERLRQDSRELQSLRQRLEQAERERDLLHGHATTAGAMWLTEAEFFALRDVLPGKPQTPAHALELAPRYIAEIRQRAELAEQRLAEQAEQERDEAKRQITEALGLCDSTAGWSHIVAVLRARLETPSAAQPWYTEYEVERWLAGCAAAFGECPPYRDQRRDLIPHAKWIAEQLQAAFEKGKQIESRRAELAEQRLAEQAGVVEERKELLRQWLYDNQSWTHGATICEFVPLIVDMAVEIILGSTAPQPPTAHGQE